MQSLLEIYKKYSSESDVTGGIYVIEDVRNIDDTKEIFLNLSKNVTIFDFRHLKNRSDDVIVEIIK